MTIYTDSLINMTIFSFFVVSIAALFLHMAFNTPPDPMLNTVFSFGSGLMVSICIVFFLKGFLPFFHGSHIPLKGLLVLCPLCALPLVPLVGNNIEISGNIIIDAIILGSILGLAIAIMGTGICVIGYQDSLWKAMKLMIVIGLFVAVIIRAILWTTE